MKERLILWLIRRKLKVRKHEKFQFENQKKLDVYFFDERGLRKIKPDKDMCKSKVSLNWLLDKECKVRR